jgi:acyl dehydratase
VSGHAHDPSLPQIPVDRVEEWIGHEFATDWVAVGQPQIQAFADATGDDNWIHLDEARATPLHGGTIAHGFLVLTLLPHLGYGLFQMTGTRQILNYGVDSVRFTAPVLAGSRIRLRLTLVSVEPRGEAKLQRWRFVFDREGKDKPACVGEMLSLAFPLAATG